MNFTQYCNEKKNYNKFVRDDLKFKYTVPHRLDVQSYMHNIMRHAQILSSASIVLSELISIKFLFFFFNFF